MTAKKTTAIGLFFLPLFVMASLQVVVDPLGDIISISWIYFCIWYGLSALIGFILYRRTQVTKDHEYRRFEVMKKMKNVYEAESKGVWEKDVELSSDIALDKDKLNSSIGTFDREAPELQVKEDEDSEVRLLGEQGFVQKASNRLSGKTDFDGEEIDSTVGSIRKKSWMDGVIDSIYGLFGKDVETEREQKRMQRLNSNAQQSPVVAQRPVAPIQKVKKTSDAKSNDLDTMTTMSDGGGIISSIEQSVKQIPDVPSIASQSIESMAMLGTVQTQAPALQIQSSGTTSGCSACGFNNPPGERYCQSCGTTLPS
jgi:hypothetical protein